MRFYVSQLNGTADGVGSEDKPMDGSDLDVVFERLEALVGIEIILASGVYTTRGAFAQRPLQKGWKLQGAGIDRTIIQLTDVYSDPYSIDTGYNCVLATHNDQDTNGVEVSDLTIDCNYSEVAKIRPKATLDGVHLIGKGNKICRVKVVNAASYRVAEDGKTPLEGFILCLSGFSDNSYGNIIEDCEVSGIINPDGKGYLTCITVQNNPYWNSIITGTVRNCTIIGTGSPSEFGLNLGCTRDLLFEGNRVIGCGRCFNNDSGTNRNVMLRSNYFRTGLIGAYFDKTEDGIFEGNIIELTAQGAAAIVFDQQFGQNCKNVVVRHNVFRSRMPAGQQGVGVMTNFLGLPTPPKNLSVCHNVIDGALLNLCDPKAGWFYENYTPDGKHPKGIPINSWRTA
jgi:hypothetical protein